MRITLVNPLKVGLGPMVLVIAGNLITILIPVWNQFRVLIV